MLKPIRLEELERLLHADRETVLAWLRA